MIIRYHVNCPGCDAIIRLRLSVGLDKEQPFFYVCQNCQAATKGQLNISYDPDLTHSLFLEDGAVVDDVETPNQVVSIHPDFPANPNEPLEASANSPYLLFFGILGERITEFMKRLGQFRSTCDQDWVSFKRLITYYLNSNWDHFELEGNRILEEQWPSTGQKAWRCHDAMQKILELLFIPLQIKNYYIDLKMEFNFEMINDGSDLDAMRSYFSQSLTDIEDLQKRLFDCLIQFVEVRSAILPGLPLIFASVSANAKLKDVRLYRDDFPVLRDLYLSSFEACHHSLKYIAAMVNIVQRGDANNFATRVSDLSKFLKQTNGKKLDHISGLPQLHKLWTLMLDRKLRNALAHHSCRHDLQKGVLTTLGESPISYCDFAVKCLDLVYPLLYSLQVLKMTHIVQLM